MDESQILILDTQQRLLADWQSSCGHMPKPDDAISFWHSIGELGLLGALAPDSAGGLGDDADFTFEFLRQWGQAAAPGPMIATLIGGGALLPGTAHAGLLDGIADGSVRLAIPTIVRTPGLYPATATNSGDGAVADLLAVAILRDAAFATHAILPSRINGEAALLCVDIGRLTLSDPFRLIDGASAAGLVNSTLAIGDGDILRRGTAAEMAWIAAMDRMTAAASCEAVGLLRAMLEQTAAYSRQRVQFGQPISAFQVVQHRLADMLVDVEQAHSLALAAIRAPGDMALVSAAKVRVNRSLQYVADHAVQLHGGIGTTQELSLNRYFRRAMALVREYGSSVQHFPRIETGLLARIDFSRTDA